MNTAFGILVVVALVGTNAFFVAAEFAMVAADRARLNAEADSGRRVAKAAVGVLRRMSFHLSGAQLGITVSSLVLGFVAEPVVAKLIDPVVVAFGGSEGSFASIALALALATVFQMVAGELIPKNFAVAKPEATLLALTPAIRIVDGLMKPFIVSFNGVANALVRRLGIEPQEELHEISSLEEIEYLIRSSAESGSLDSDALSLLTRTLRFGDKIAADALKPRPKLSALHVDQTVGEMIAQSIETGHSRFPVYGEDLDDIVGVADIAKVFDLPLAQRSEVSVREIMVDPVVIPETKDLIDIVSDFRESDIELIVVVDEHGGTAGILTLEDVLEEIAGEIDDEYDDAEVPVFADLASGVYIIEGSLHADEVFEACGFEVPDGEYETLAGFVLRELGRIPTSGDGLLVDGWAIEVVEMDGLRIATVQMTKPNLDLEAQR